MVELQKDPITRGDFLGFGVMGAIVGAILTIPPVAFVLSPIIKTDVLGESDVGSGWVEVASVADVSAEETEAYVSNAAEITDTMTTLVGVRSRVPLELAAESFDEVVDAGVRLQAMTNVGTTGTLFASRERLVIGPTEG